MSFKLGSGIKLGPGIGVAGRPPVGKKAPDPLADVAYTGDLEKDSAAELTAMEEAYRGRAKAEQARFTAATDSEYWFAVCFKSREDKEAFLRATGLLRHGDKYLDGYAAAHALGVEIS
jgi:hypothetical protein